MGRISFSRIMVEKSAIDAPHNAEAPWFVEGTYSRKGEDNEG
jgi:hypothetical protein